MVIGFWLRNENRRSRLYVALRQGVRRDEAIAIVNRECRDMGQGWRLRRLVHGVKNEFPGSLRVLATEQ